MLAHAESPSVISSRSQSTDSNPPFSTLAVKSIHHIDLEDLKRVGVPPAFLSNAKLSNGDVLKEIALVNRLEPKAIAGDPESQYELGIMCEFGRGIPRMDKKALKWYSKAADSGLVDAQYRLGISYLSAKDYLLAVKYLRKAMIKGHVIAQYCMGMMYLHGDTDFVEPNLFKAFKWLNKAAEQGYPNAQYAVGIMLINGDGVIKDEEEGTKWFRKAAKQGHPEAKDTLKWNYVDEQGEVLINGEGSDYSNKSEEQNATYSMVESIYTVGSMAVSSIYEAGSVAVGVISSVVTSYQDECD